MKLGNCLLWLVILGSIQAGPVWAQSITTQSAGAPQEPIAQPAQQPATSSSPSANLPKNLAQQQIPATGPLLTLADAEARALSHQPRLQAERLRASAAGKAVQVSRSSYFPQLTGNLTAVQANGDSAVAAGNVTTSSVSTRAAGGLSLLQLVTDFGRTRDLVRSTRLTAEAADQNTMDIRRQILRNVDAAYFAVQAAESVKQTAQAVLNYRRLSLNQLQALAQSQLRSTLDVEFAQVLVSEAELAVYRANSGVEETRAQLTAAMGDENDPDYTLRNEGVPLPPDNNVNTYISEAFANRPDLKSFELRAASAHQFALSEKKLSYPTVNLIGTAGELPEHDSTLKTQYAAAGINISIPILNGGRYSSEHAEAELKAQARDRDVADLRVDIAQAVRSAWAQAQDAYLQIDVAQRLVAQSTEALRLAQAKYDAGLGSIVELNEAELSQTSALITEAGAKYDYMTQNATLLYTLGVR